MVTQSQTPPQPFTLVIGDDPVYSLDTDRRRIGIGTRLPQRRLHLVTPDAVVARFESTGAAVPQVEFRGSGGSGTLSYNSATGQWVLGTDLESTDTSLAVDVLSVPDGSATGARISIGDSGNLRLFASEFFSAIKNSNTALAIGTSSAASVELQTNDVTALTIGSNQLVTCSKGITVNTTALASAFAVADGTGQATCKQTLFVDKSSGESLLDLSSGAAVVRIYMEGSGGRSSINYASASDCFTVDSQLRVMKVADATAESALSAVEGAIIYREDTNKHRGYDGSAWNDLY